LSLGTKAYPRQWPPQTPLYHTPEAIRDQRVHSWTTWAAGVKDPPVAGIEDPPAAGIDYPPAAGMDDPLVAGVDDPPLWPFMSR